MRLVLSTIIVEFPAAIHNLEVKIEHRDSINVRAMIAAHERGAAKSIASFNLLIPSSSSS
jgi:hypothetical protein